MNISPITTHTKIDIATMDEINLPKQYKNT